MRPILLITCMAALCGASPGLAQGAPDCDVVCRLTGYLSSDHMAEAPATPAAAAPATHRRKPHAEAVPAVKAAPRLVNASKAAAAAKAPARVPVARVAAKGPEDAKPAVAARVAPVKTRTAKTGAPPPEKVAVFAEDPPPLAAAVPPPRPARQAEAPVAEAAPPAPRKPARMARPTPTLTASALIPGSAPMMPAGFQPPAATGLH